MRVRTSVAGAALIAVAVFGVAACGDDNDSSSTTAAVSATATSPSSDGATGAPALEVGAAQEVIVGVLSPDTDPGMYPELVASGDPALAGQLAGLSRGFSAAGYTADKFTVTQVSADGDTAATATVEVAGPHTPEPVAMPMAFVYVDGAWKLSPDAITALTSMAGGR